LKTQKQPKEAPILINKHRPSNNPPFQLNPKKEVITKKPFVESKSPFHQFLAYFQNFKQTITKAPQK
jgi:hypothetical protein